MGRHLGMRIETTAAELAHAVATAEQAIRGAAMGSVSIVATGGGIQVVGSDGELTLAVSLDGTCSQEGNASVIPKPLAAYAAALSGDVQLSCRVEGGRLIVDGAGRTYKFALVESVAATVTTPGEGSSVCSAAHLQSLYSACRHGVDPRTQLVKLSAGEGRLHMYATDSYRLVSASVERVEGSWSILLPSNALAVALRHAPEQLVVDQRGRVAAFRGAKVETTVRLGAGGFPAVEGVIAATPGNACELPTEGLLEALQRISSVAGNEPLRCELTDTQLVLTAVSAEGTGSEVVAATVDVPIAFGIGAKNLRDALQACDTARVRCSYADARAPIHLMNTESDVQVTCVVMPIVWSGAEQ